MSIIAFSGIDYPIGLPLTAQTTPLAAELRKTIPHPFEHLGPFGVVLA